MAKGWDRAWVVAAVVGALSLAVLGAWVIRGSTGLADNGDWDRYTCPVGLSGQVRFDDVPEELVATKPCLAFDYRSSFVPFLAAAKAVDTALSGGLHLSHLAAFWVVVTSLGWAWLGFELARVLRRWWHALVVTAAMVVVAADPAFSAYFGSAYGEALVIALLPALAAGVVRLCRTERFDLRASIVTGFVVTVLTAAKPSMALTAVIVVGVVATARRTEVTIRGLGPVVLATVALTLFSLVGIADPEFSSWNTYNLAFTVVTPESGDAHAALRDMGLDEQQAGRLERFVGVPFGPEVTDAEDDPALQAFEANGKGPVLKALAKRPVVWVRMLDEGASTLDDLHLDYLANHHRLPGDPAGPVLSSAPRPADLVLAPVSAVRWAIPLVWLAPVVWWGRRLVRGPRTPDAPESADAHDGTDPGRSRSSTAVAALVVAAVAFAATQTVLALGDGYYELAKHLSVAGYATALVVTGLAVAGLIQLGERLPGERRSVGNS
ncbi:MAG: glycan biosynthesis hexose transferase WsfD [Aquihabitans sp.]